MKDKNNVYFYIAILLLLLLIYFNFNFNKYKEGGPGDADPFSGTTCSPTVIAQAQAKYLQEQQALDAAKEAALVQSRLETKAAEDETARLARIITDPLQEQINIDEDIINELQIRYDNYVKLISADEIQKLENELEDMSSNYYTEINRMRDETATLLEQAKKALVEKEAARDALQRSEQEQAIQAAINAQITYDSEKYDSAQNNINSQILQNIGNYTPSNTLYNNVNSIDDKLGSEYNESNTLYNSVNDLSNNVISRLDSNTGNLNTIKTNTTLLTSKTNDNSGVLNSMNNTLLSLKDNSSTLTDKMGNFVGPNPENLFSKLGPYTNENTLYKTIDELDTNMKRNDSILQNILYTLSFLKYDSSYSPVDTIIDTSYDLSINDDDIDDLYCTSSYGDKDGVPLCCGRTGVVNGENNLYDQCTSVRPYCKQVGTTQHGICQLKP
jgi:hypothetical protein